MRIAYFLDTAEGLGGAGNLLLNQARIMSSLHDVLMVIPCTPEGVPNAEYVSRCDKNGLRWKSLYYTTWFKFYGLNLLASLKQTEAIEALLKEERIELCHSVQLNIALELAARRVGIPNLMDIYQLSDSDFRTCWGDLYPSYHLCDSNLYSDKWARNLGIVSRCIRPISPLKEVRVRPHVKKDRYELLVLGRVCPRKNQLEAIRIVQKLSAIYPVHLTIAGELVEEYAATCLDHVKEHHLEDLVEFRDFVSDIGPLMEACDIFLCPSLDESFPSSIVEAVSYDLTIVTTPVGGVPEVFHDRENAFVSRDLSEEAFEEALTACLRAYETSGAEFLHRQARRTWEDLFFEGSIRKKIDAYYDFIMQDHRRRDVPEKQIKEAEALAGELLETREDFSAYTGRILYMMKLRETMRNSQATIWGAGKLGERARGALSVICPTLKVTSFTDRNRVGTWAFLPVITPEELVASHPEYVIIAYKGDTGETVRLLEEAGYVLNETCWILN